jgi:hypothetical protein
VIADRDEAGEQRQPQPRTGERGEKRADLLDRGDLFTLEEKRTGSAVIASCDRGEQLAEVVHAAP